MLKNLIHDLGLKNSPLAGDPRAWLNPERMTLIVTAVVLFLSYLPNLASLAHTWSNDPNYTHGFLVIPIALVIFWTRPQFPEPSPRWFTSRMWAWGGLVCLSAVRLWMYEGAYQWLETVTLVPTIICLIWTYGGIPLLRRSWPALVFLMFLFPLPQSINSLVSLRLQKLATLGSSFLMQLTGLWVIPDGNIININTGKELEKLEVANVCNGLSMLMSLSAVVIATITLIPMPVWKRIALLASVVPIALFSNVLRIVATGWCYYLFGGEQSRHLAHDWAGFLMMPLALGLVLLEMVVLSWLADEGGEFEDDPRLLMPLLTARES
jgi:exosortase